MTNATPSTLFTDYPFTITRQHLVDAGACSESINDFDTRYPEGEVTIAGPEAQSALLSAPLGGYESWAEEEGILPPIKLTGGDRTMLTGGYYSQLTGGDESMLTGGDRSTLTGGDDSILTARDHSTLTGGPGSALTGGNCSTLTGGDGSVLSWRWWDGTRLRLTTVYVGEDGIEAGVAYTCDRGVVSPVASSAARR